MKKLIIVIVLILRFLIAQSQDDSANIFLSANEKMNLYVELQENNAIVFELYEGYDKISIWHFKYIDTLVKQIDTPCNYISKNAKLVLKGNKYQIIRFSNNRKQDNIIQLDTINNLSKVNFKINNALWWQKFIPFSDSIQSMFPLYNYNFYNGLNIWESFLNKEIYYKDFAIYADYKIKTLKDSIISIQNFYSLTTDKILNNISSIQYSELKDSLIKLPAEYRNNSWYFGTIINKISTDRSELFFKLADDFPEKRKIIFAAVDDNKETINQLKSINTTSPSKKQFFKERREAKFEFARLITLSSLILGGTIYLLIRKN